MSCSVTSSWTMRWVWPGLGLLERLLRLRQLLVGDPPRPLEVAAPLGGRQLVAQLLELLLQLGGARELALLGLPLRGQLGGALLQLGELAAQALQPVLRGAVALLLERRLLDPELEDAAVELVDLLGLAVDLHPLARGRLVDQVDRLVGQEAVGDVAVGEGGGGHDGIVGDPHAVVQLVLLLQPAQDRDRVLDIGLADEHRLEAAGEGRVLLDVLAVLVERRRADAMQLAAGQRRLQHVGGVHRPFRLARTHQRVQLVDEEDDVALAVADLLEEGLEPLLELAAILGTGHEGAEVERQEAPVAERLGHVAIDDALRQAFGDGGLADAGLADQDRVVLGPAGEHLDDAADLVVAADHRVELALAGGRGEVAGILLERLVAVLGPGGLGGAALAHGLDRTVQRLRRDAGTLERLAGIGLGRGDREQQPLDRDEAVAGLLRDLLGLIEQACRLGRHVQPAGTAALDLRQLLQQRLGRLPCGLRIAARGLDQVGGQPFLVVEQHLQHVLGQEALVAFAQGHALRRLDEALQSVGILLDVHLVFPLSPSCEQTGRCCPGGTATALHVIWAFRLAPQGIEPGPRHPTRAVDRSWPSVPVAGQWHGPRSGAARSCSGVRPPASPGRCGRDAGGR